MKNKLIKVNCRRCDCVLLTCRKSHFMAESVKAELGSLCSECITPQERDRILSETMQAALNTLVIAPRQSPPTRKI